MAIREDARHAQKIARPPERQVNKDQKPARLAGNSGGQAKRVISAGFIVFRRTREGTKFLILYHGGSYWNFPKGTVESEEKSLAAALRETREETGLASTDLRIIENFRAHERFAYRWAGQPYFKIVILYLAETRNPHVKVSDEHEGYGWFLPGEAAKILGKYRDSQRVLKQAIDFLKMRARPQQRPTPQGGQIRQKSTQHPTPPRR